MEGFTAVGARTLIARVFSTAFKDHTQEKANAELIAALRNAAPRLLAIAEAAEKLVMTQAKAPEYWEAEESLRAAVKGK